MVTRAQARARKTAPKTSAAVAASSLPDRPAEAAATAPPPAPEETGESRADTPLDYMLRVMRNPASDDERRDQMAKVAAPYVHPRLAAIQHTGKDGGPIGHANISDTELARAIAFTLAKAVQAKPIEHLSTSGIMAPKRRRHLPPSPTP